MFPQRYGSASSIQSNTSISNVSNSSSTSSRNSNSRKCTYNFAIPISYVEQETKTSKFSFVLCGAPTNRNLKHYIRKFQEFKISTIVRVCEPTYSDHLLKQQNIDTVDLSFPDGSPPNEKIINKWLDIVSQENINKKKPLAIHCVAGLGRSSVLVAVALIEFAHMQALDAIDLIRRYRRGAINEKQAEWLANYQVKRQQECCIIL